MWCSGGRSAAANAVLAGSVLVSGLAVAPADAGDGRGDANGRVSVVYESDTFGPGDRHAVAVLKDARAIERITDWVNERVALPHDLTVKVTGKVPPGVTDAVTQPDGRTIYVPPAFLTRIEGVLGRVVKTVKRPAILPADRYNTGDLAALSVQFVLGHELGHALQRQLQLANLALEEDAADGFASFSTVNDSGAGPSLAAALLFDQLARDEGELTLEGLSSDHPVTQQRVFTFLCHLAGSDPRKYDGPLVGAGYLPKTRALLCPQAWAMLDYGWWTQLQPQFPRAFEAQGDRARAKAHARLVAETKALADRLDEIRSGQ
ncbi:DUF4344 domain-containing metallopeptidase [Streptomyces sp. 900105245]